VMGDNLYNDVRYYSRTTGLIVNDSSATWHLSDTQAVFIVRSIFISYQLSAGAGVVTVDVDAVNLFQISNEGVTQLDDSRCIACVFPMLAGDSLRASAASASAQVIASGYFVAQQ